MRNSSVATLPDAEPTRSRSRNSNLELLRIFAAFGIVAYHAKAPYPDIPYAGLILFLALSPFVEATFNWHKNRPVMQMVQTLMVPWAFWLVAYAAANMLMKKPPLPAGFSLSSVLYGSSPHLWFLPFIFAVGLALRLLKRLPHSALVFWPSVAIATVLLVSAPAWRPLAMELPVPYAQWAHAAAAIFAGLALGLHRLAGRAAWAGAIMIGAGLLACLAYRLPGMSITYLFGIGALAMGAFLPELFAGQAKAIRAVSECMFGVYLMHIFILALIGRFTPTTNYTTSFVIFGIALVCTWAARRIVPLTKMILG